MNNEKSKYNSQIKHLRAKYKRLTMDFKPEELEEFKAACASNNTTATHEIKEFMRRYCEENKRGRTL